MNQKFFFPNFVCISLMLFNLVSLWWHYCCFFHGLMLDYCFLWKIFHYVLFAIYFLCYGFLKRIDPLQRKNFNNEKIAKNKYKYIDTIIYALNVYLMHLVNMTYCSPKIQHSWKKIFKMFWRDKAILKWFLIHKYHVLLRISLKMKMILITDVLLMTLSTKPVFGNVF